MFFYSYFSGHGREILSHTLKTEDPFGLAPAEILDRILAAGYVPFIDEPKLDPWRSIGTVTNVKRGDCLLTVAVSREAQEITLQEMRADAYLPSE